MMSPKISGSLQIWEHAVNSCTVTDYHGAAAVKSEIHHGA
jgi:hypothetical protein